MRGGVLSPDLLRYLPQITLPRTLQTSYAGQLLHTFPFPITVYDMYQLYVLCFVRVGAFSQTCTH